MGKRIALNTFYTIIIFIGLLGCFYTFKNPQQYGYWPLAAFIPMVLYFIYLKVQLLKQLRNSSPEK